jgi:MFS family permease
LVSKDRHEEALRILVKYHAEGDAASPLVAAEFHQIRQTIRLEIEASKSPWKELVATKTNLRRVLIAICVGFFTQWSGNGLVSYYLAKVLESIGITERRIQNQLNLGLMCWNLVTGVTGSFITHYMRRRVQYLISYSAMTILFACWTAASAVYAQDNDNSASGRAVVALIFIYYGFYNLMMPLTYIYLSEVFPFLQRSKGVAITQFFSRGGSAFNSFVNPIGLDSIAWRYYIVYVVWLACETTIIFFLFPETKGVTLEEAAIVIDGDRANVEIVHVGATDKAGASVEEREYGEKH